MKYVSEIFGYDSRYTLINSSRKEYLCPFQDKETQCDPVNKKSNLTDKNGERLLKHQTGACSCNYKSKKRLEYKPAIICPNRFLEKNEKNGIKVFEKINNFFFANKKIKFVKEVGLGPYGQADYMIAIFDKDNQIIDFGHCEFQSDATTGTRGIVECVKDFYQGKDINKNYTYGLNTKATIKGFSLQMIDKGYLFKKLNKPSIWVMQDNLVSSFSDIYNLDLNEIDEYDRLSDNNIFIIETRLIENRNKNKYELEVNRILSTSSFLIQNSLSNKKEISEKDILKKIKKNIY